MHLIISVPILWIIFLTLITHLKVYGFTVFCQRRDWEVRHGSAEVRMVERQDPFFFFLWENAKDGGRSRIWLHPESAQTHRHFL